MSKNVRAAILIEVQRHHLAHHSSAGRAGPTSRCNSLRTNARSNVRQTGLRPDSRKRACFHVKISQPPQGVAQFQDVHWIRNRGTRTQQASGPVPDALRRIGRGALLAGSIPQSIPTSRAPGGPIPAIPAGGPAGRG